MELKHVETDRLDIAYLEHGPTDGRPVLLLHGFPDDATGWTAVMEVVARDGYRAIAPFVRGVGETRFLDASTPRAGDFPALGGDALDFVDRLDLHNLVVVGQDWGSPTSEIVAAERADRVRRLIKLNWYGVYTMAEMQRAQGFAYPQLRALWYVWLLNTGLGPMILDYDREGFARTLWAEWSPSWDSRSREAALARVVGSFGGADYVRVVLSAYRAGISDSERDPAHDALRAALGELHPVRCDTLILTGADDGVEKSPLSAEAVRRYFRGKVEMRALAGVGHFPQREAPDAVARAITDG